MVITAKSNLDLKYWRFEITYHKFSWKECIVLSHWEIDCITPIIRIHSSCLFWESFHALDCDCNQQLQKTLALIKKQKSWAIVYTYAEWRWVWMENKIKLYEIQNKKKKNTIQAFEELWFPPDVRTYDAEVNALKDIWIPKDIFIVTDNPNKLSAIKNAGFNILKKIDLDIPINKFNRSELKAKKNMLWYDLNHRFIKKWKK